MAQRLDPVFNNSVPSASDAGPVESFHTSPESSHDSLATMMPANGLAGNLAGSVAESSSAAVAQRAATNAYQERPVSQVEGDPFFDPQGTVGMGLSPMAMAFQPTGNGARALGFAAHEQTDAVADFLSTDLGITRLIEVNGGGITVSVIDVENYLASMAGNAVEIHGDRTLSVVDRSVYINFEDIRDAGWAYTALRKKTEWIIGYLHGNLTANGYEYAGDQRLTHLGQVAVFASPPVGAGPANPDRVMEAAKVTLNAHGQLFGLVKQLGYPDGSFRAMSQFCKVADAISAVEVFNGPTPQGVHLEVTAPMGPNLPKGPMHGGDDLSSAMHGLALVRVDANRQGAGPGNRGMYQQEGARAPFIPTGPANTYADRAPHGAHYGMQGMNQSYSLVGPVYQGPPSPAMTHRNGNNVLSPSRFRGGNSYGYGHNTGFQPRRHLQTPRSQFGRGRHGNNSNNHVDLQEVMSGRDCRTTIMLRNIPNKVDQPMLKEFVDQSSFGQYDFMYLRIDFANDCNVGYAFINFVKAEYIIPFVEARANKRWNLFRSDKVAEVSYATIQGKDCLVQKFRNSSVMLENEHYRPKLFYTLHSEDEQLAGREEPFPGPDNQSKMKRSCENAEHVGLFTPNAGQHYRDEQRRRRSQFDRGTRLAVLEEMHETALAPYYGRNMNMRR